MGKEWISKEDELPSAYEEVEILMTDGTVAKDMIIRGKCENLEWTNFADGAIKAWREIS